jgi:hypothetical protein
MQNNSDIKHVIVGIAFDYRFSAHPYCTSYGFVLSLWRIRNIIYTLKIFFLHADKIFSTR